MNTRITSRLTLTSLVVVVIATAGAASAEVYRATTDHTWFPNGFYVHEDDAIAAYEFAEGWTIEGFGTLMDLDPGYWLMVRDWAVMSGNTTRIAMENTWTDSRVTVLKYTDDGVAAVKMVAGSTSRAVTVVLDEAEDLDEALAVVEGVLADGANAVGDALSDWAAGIGQDYADAVTDLLADARAIYKKVKFW